MEGLGYYESNHTLFDYFMSRFDISHVAGQIKMLFIGEIKFFCKQLLN